MSYNIEEFPRYVRTAGKITMVTALAGLFVFLFALVFDVGTQEFSRVSAQTASTTLTVLNTPPAFTVAPYEVVGSATTTPTNSGSVVSWSAIGTDSNSAPYFLLICSTNASPTANNAIDIFNLGTEPPECGAGAVQWGVSTSTVSGELATVATTTLEGGQFSTSTPNNWYAWVCDDDPSNPRCNIAPSQGLYATSSSPFHVNSRPVFSAFGNDGPKDPGASVTFFSTSSDPDTLGGDQNIYLVVCSTNTDYNATTNTCATNFIASTTVSIQSDASAIKTLASVLRDDTYGAYGYIVDQYGHEATANPINFDFDVNNVAPTVLGGDIDLNEGSDLILATLGGETTGYTLDFRIRDANSCLTAASTTDEIKSFNVAIFRSSYGTSTLLNPDACDGTAGSYDPNYCYPNGIASTTWNLSCAATSTCASPAQDYVDYSCTFPLWFVADPTDPGPNTPALFAADEWSAAVAGTDEALTGPMATTSNGVEVGSLAGIDILSTQIAYGGIEPGFDSTTLNASSTAVNVGNTGLDQEVRGVSMCGTYALGNDCPSSATSTIPDWRQQFSTSTYAYDADATELGTLLNPNILQLSSTTNKHLELNVPKTTATTSALWENGTTYWGIAVPVTITLAGSYKGLNTFTAATAEAIDW
jgi:hypothetical protein